jgi:hypothetical protein
MNSLIPSEGLDSNEEPQRLAYDWKIQLYRNFYRLFKDTHVIQGKMTIHSITRTNQFLYLWFFTLQ